MLHPDPRKELGSLPPGLSCASVPVHTPCSICFCLAWQPGASSWMHPWALPEGILTTSHPRLHCIAPICTFTVSLSSLPTCLLLNCLILEVMVCGRWVGDGWGSLEPSLLLCGDRAGVEFPLTHLSSSSLGPQCPSSQCTPTWVGLMEYKDLVRKSAQARYCYHWHELVHSGMGT